MGCISSREKSTTFCYSKEYVEKQLWISRPKNVYKVNPGPRNLKPISGLKYNHPVATKPTEILSICDDFQEGCDDEKSFGYFSESISTANTSEISFNTDDGDFKMEMYMMTKISRVMPRTSSPIVPRKFSSSYSPSAAAPDAGFHANMNEPPKQRPKRSYDKWKQHLQYTPPCVLNTVTGIPEALAGQFMSERFPGYTDVHRFQKCCFPTQDDSYSMTI